MSQDWRPHVCFLPSSSCLMRHTLQIPTVSGKTGLSSGHRSADSQPPLSRHTGQPLASLKKPDLFTCCFFYLESAYQVGLRPIFPAADTAIPHDQSSVVAPSHTCLNSLLLVSGVSFIFGYIYFSPPNYQARTSPAFATVSLQLKQGRTHCRDPRRVSID